MKQPFSQKVKTVYLVDGQAEDADENTSETAE